MGNLTAEAPSAPDSDPGLEAEVVTIADLMDKSLSIPDYQRPYKWTVRNADQMLTDIWRFRDSGAYRLGTVIVHEYRTVDDEQVVDIVDGQQRYLTLSLLLLALGEHGAQGGRRDNDLEPMRARKLPRHGQRITSTNIRANYVHFVQTLGSWTKSDRDELTDLVLDRCQVVLLRLRELDAAFQMFDSQNTRGRALFATDLLKAFHIREMRGRSVTDQLRAEMVDLWESIPPESVNALFSDYLFKIKRWANGQGVPPSGFTSGHVSMFKGIREGDPANMLNRWSMPYLFAKNYTDDFRAENDTLIRYGALPPVPYPFQIDQPVLNGETFFEMVAHYYRLGLAIGLFPDDSRQPIEGRRAPFGQDTMATLAAVREDLDRFRKDRRFDFVVNLFECLLLYYLDRFDGQELERAVHVFLKYTMGLRAEMTKLQRVTVNNYALGYAPSRKLESTNAFSELRQSLSPRDFLLRPLPPTPSQWGNYEEILRKYFDDDVVLPPRAERRVDPR